MGAYLARRILGALVTIWLVVTAVFVVFFIVPGGQGRKGPGGISPITIFLAGVGNDIDRLRQIEHDLGIDRPVYVQYGKYLNRLIQGDLGHSYISNVPVWPIVKGAIAPTAQLAVGATALALGVGVAAGALSIRTRSRWTDRSLMGFSLASMAMPTFVVAVIALHLLSRSGLGVEKYRPLQAGIWGWFRSMWLPWVVLALPFLGAYARVTRTTLLDVAGEQYIRTARAKGLDERGLMRHHLRAGVLPVVTLYALDLGKLLGGAIIVEKIFEIPGLGFLVLSPSYIGDFPVIMGVTIVATSAVVVLNLLVDVVYVYLDPRIVYGKSPI